ncbi:hypothetical protein [Paenibacillus ottowii]|uniref:hypothetical protein n=1 Tax=Paenibacillus ottowii TaxID=2315729 RepID=UPI0013905D10|nr:hypothetical protein [Paenibacillus ottowii]
MSKGIKLIAIAPNLQTHLFLPEDHLLVNWWRTTYLVIFFAIAGIIRDVVLKTRPLKP